MRKSEYYRKMEIRRSVDVDPRRTPQAAWLVVCKFFTEVLDSFGYLDPTGVRQDLCALSQTAASLLLLRSLIAVRLSSEIFEIDVVFQCGSAESNDSLDPPIVLQVLEDDAPLGLALIVPQSGLQQELLKSHAFKCLAVSIESDESGDSYDEEKEESHV